MWSRLDYNFHFQISTPGRTPGWLLTSQEWLEAFRAAPDEVAVPGTHVRGYNWLEGCEQECRAGTQASATAGTGCWVHLHEAGEGRNSPRLGCAGRLPSCPAAGKVDMMKRTVLPIKLTGTAIAGWKSAWATTAGHLDAMDLFTSSQEWGLVLKFEV